jgi:hypothetical protein
MSSLETWLARRKAATSGRRELARPVVALCYGRYVSLVCPLSSWFASRLSPRAVIVTSDFQGFHIGVADFTAGTLAVSIVVSNDSVSKGALVSGISAAIGAEADAPRLVVIDCLVALSLGERLSSICTLIEDLVSTFAELSTVLLLIDDSIVGLHDSLTVRSLSSTMPLVVQYCKFPCPCDLVQGICSLVVSVARDKFSIHHGSVFVNEFANNVRARTPDVSSNFLCSS